MPPKSLGLGVGGACANRSISERPTSVAPLALGTVGIVVPDSQQIVTCSTRLDGSARAGDAAVTWSLELPASRVVVTAVIDELTIDYLLGDRAVDPPSVFPSGPLAGAEILTLILRAHEQVKLKVTVGSVVSPDKLGPSYDTIGPTAGLRLVVHYSTPGLQVAFVNALDAAAVAKGGADPAELSRPVASGALVRAPLRFRIGLTDIHGTRH